jgi:uncharacterized protein YozE (UPF0346 family)
MTMLGYILLNGVRYLMKKIKEKQTEDKIDFKDIVDQLSEVEQEITTLEKISHYTESLTQRLYELYSDVFPKKCNNCGKLYNSRSEYIKDTYNFSLNSTLYDEIGVQEYRNCKCGSTLLIITDDRRDMSSFGKVRRELFRICVNKIEKITGKDKSIIEPVVRNIFRRVLDEKLGKNEIEDIYTKAKEEIS